MGPTIRLRTPAKVAGNFSEWWPGSIRNPGRDQIGMVAGITSESARLKLYISDSRSDVQGVGTKLMIARLEAQPDLASTFLTDIEEGRLAPRMLGNALAAEMDWDEANLARVEAMLASPQVELCTAAMALLRTPYRPIEVILEWATKLVRHNDSEIRERAYRILDGVPKPA